MWGEMCLGPGGVAMRPLSVPVAAVGRAWHRQRWLRWTRQPLTEVISAAAWRDCQLVGFLRGFLTHPEAPARGRAHSGGDAGGSSLLGGFAGGGQPPGCRHLSGSPCSTADRRGVHSRYVVILDISALFFKYMVFWVEQSRHLDGHP